MDAQVELSRLAAPGAVQPEPALADVLVRAALCVSNAVLVKKLFQIHLFL